ncbi:Tn3 family transposase [Rhizobium beringeri]
MATKHVDDTGALHVDSGGVSDIVFAIAALLGRSFEPRIPPVGPQTLCIQTENKIWPSGAACLDTGSTLT